MFKYREKEVRWGHIRKGVGHAVRAYPPRLQKKRTRHMELLAVHKEPFQQTGDVQAGINDYIC